MIRFHRPVFAIYRAAFHQGQQIPLDALPGNIRPLTAFLAGDFIDFIKKNDAGLFDLFDGVLTTFSMSTSPWASSWTRISMASGILIFRRLVFLGSRLPNMSLKLYPHLFHADIGKNLHHGGASVGNFHVHKPLVKLAGRSIRLSFSRVAAPLSSIAAKADRYRLPVHGVLPHAWGPVFSAAAGPAFSPRQYGGLFPEPPPVLSLLSWPTVCSSISRTIDSTSRPTYPTSVNLDASTLINGESVSLESRRAISVLPTPGGADQNDVLGSDFVLEGLRGPADAGNGFSVRWPRTALPCPDR